MGGPGSGGHNRLSPEERRARGTSRADRDHSGQRAPPKAKPTKGKKTTAPEWLSAEAKLVWQRVAPTFPAMTALEAEQLANYAEAQVLAQQASRRLRREGLTKKRPDGSEVVNALVKLARDCRQQALVFAKALGLGVATGAEDLVDDSEAIDAERFARAEKFLFGGKPPNPAPRPWPPPQLAPTSTTASTPTEPGPAITTPVAS